MTPDDDQLDKIFMALSDRTRREMLQRLQSGPHSVSELAEGIALSQPTISKHLKVLESAGLIERTRDGNRIYSILNIDPLVRASIFVSQFEKVVDARLDRLAQVVEPHVEKHTQ